MMPNSCRGSDLITPPFLYGTAWKEDDTQRLTELAIEQGFRGIDTANQRKHYHEAGVGQAIASARLKGVGRDKLFLQTKFTFQAGQDHRLPYDPRLPIARQVEQSFASSLEHLGVDYLDCYVLHGPSQRQGLATADWDAWRAMEAVYESGKTRLLGISNVGVDQLRLLLAQARVPPRFVQNRCYAVRAWDRDVRDVCRKNDIVYQGFSLLTANRPILVHPDMLHLAQKYNRTPEQIIFRFAVEVGMLPITGTTNPEHMRDDLSIVDFRLTAADTGVVETIGVV